MDVDNALSIIFKNVTSGKEITTADQANYNAAVFQALATLKLAYVVEEYVKLKG
jgi:hypothetical protein